MLYTNLKHIESEEDFQRIVHENENVLIICGRMDPLCISAYRIAEELEKEYEQVKFYDIEIDNPESAFICSLPDLNQLTVYPFALYYKNGYLVKANSGMPSDSHVRTILDHEFEAIVKA